MFNIFKRAAPEPPQPVPQPGDWSQVTLEMIEATTPTNDQPRIDWGPLPSPDMLSQPQARTLFTALQDAPGALPLALGFTPAGAPHIIDLVTLPHLLVAGTTGSGKSVLLHCMALSLLARWTPEQFQLVMIDPKMVEMQEYAAVPGAQVITDAPAALEALEWLCTEMDARYRLFSLYGVRTLDDYNAVALAANVLPRIVCVIDEYADLVHDRKTRKALEDCITRLAAKARAAGIHLILATQRPSADVLTSTIKSNLPQRIALRTGNAADSRVIIGKAGAEKLRGHGDMLFNDTRLQCPFITPEDVRAMVDHWSLEGL